MENVQFVNLCPQQRQSRSKKLAMGQFVYLREGRRPGCGGAADAADDGGGNHGMRGCTNTG